MKSIVRSDGWLAPFLAATALVVFAAVFAVELGSFRRAVIGWAMSDLKTRAELAASNLRDAIATQNFKEIRGFADRCDAAGYAFEIQTDAGGILHARERNDQPCYWQRARSGEYSVGIGVPCVRVLAPYHRARFGFVLAGLVGIAAVAFVFFATYRQHMRMQELAKMERFRRDFVADVSHEIRTPVTGILGAVDLLTDAKTDTATRLRLAELLRHSARRLNALVQAILDLARLERQDAPLDRETVNLQSLVQETVDRIRPTAEKAGFGLSFAPSASDNEGLPEISCDPQLIAQAVENLIVNAIRHSGGSSVKVRIDATSHADRLRVVVTDDGHGVSPEERERIFERFRRLDRARTEATGGAGLGLAIVRSIARLHGGDAVCRAAMPQGAEFVMDLRR